MPARPLWMNGRVVAFDDATVSVMAHAMQRGSLVFDVGTFHPTARATAIFRLGDHVARFVWSARIIGLSLAYDVAALEEAARAAVTASGLDRGLLRWSAFFPSMEADLVPRDAAAHVTVAAYVPSDTLPKGVELTPKREAWRVATFDDARKAGPEVMPPAAKVAASYLGPMLARRRAVAAGADEIVLLDREGRIAEAPTANVFVVKDGALVTPPLEYVLAGITRESVLAIAKDERIAAREAPITRAELGAADEAFLTSSSLPLGPISSVDGRAMSGGAPGPVTARIAARFARIERGEDARFGAWLSPVKSPGPQRG